MNVAVVVASNRPEQVCELLAAWDGQTLPAKWHIVFDLDETPAGFVNLSGKQAVYNHRDIKHKLGTAAWIIPTRTGAIRSFGFLMAYRAGADIVVSLDDDVRPCGPDHLARLVAALDTPVNSEWVGHGPQKQRGIPFGLEKKPSVLHEGLWWHTPDLDAPTRLVAGVDPAYTMAAPTGHRVVPPGQWLAFSAMHFAVRRDFVPALYQLLMGPDWGYHRFDDIWSGLFAKKVADHLGLPVTFGDPMVKHLQASDVYRNLEAEAPGIGEHERRWRDIAALPLTGNTVIAAYRSLAAALATFGGEYWPKLAEAMGLWCDQFEHGGAAHGGAYALRNGHWEDKPPILVNGRAPETAVVNSPSTAITKALQGEWPMPPYLDDLRPECPPIGDRTLTVTRNEPAPLNGHRDRVFANREDL